jgi:Right handed beta helix region
MHHIELKSFLRLACLGLLALVPKEVVACDITVNVPSQLTPAQSVNWSAPCGVGAGVQAALSAIESSGGGALLFTGPGSLLVSQSLRVGSNTTVYGDTSRTPFGMIIVGENTAGVSYRKPDDPVFIVSQKSNVTFWNLQFDGDQPGRPLCAQVIEINASTNVLIVYCKVEGARQLGVTIRESSYVTVSYLTLIMRRSGGTEPEGGVGIWMYSCQHCTIEHNQISSPTYYAAGPPDSDPNRWVNAAPVMDLVASYGGRYNAFQHNDISSGNSAGIYLACLGAQTNCPADGRELSPTVWDNTVHHFRQSGLDLASCDDVNVVTNRVYTIDHVALGLADCHGGVVQWNTFYDSGLLVPSGQVFGALYFLWGTSGIQASDNVIQGGQDHFSVYLKAGSEGFPNCVNNTVTNNKLWAGLSGYFGGVSSGNVISPNELH